MPAASENSAAPQWIQADLFESMLKQNVPNFKSIVSFKAYPAMAAGENYATIMLRIDTELLLQNNATSLQSYMMKIPPQNELFEQFLESYNMFDVEKQVYHNIVPEMQELYKQAGLEVRFGAKAYAIESDKPTIVLEDLRPAGFKNADRLQGLDMCHTKAVLKLLAQWHAASAQRIATKGSYDSRFTQSIFIENGREMMKAMNNANFKVLLECLKEFKDANTYYAAMEKSLLQHIDTLYDSAKLIDENEFNVLNHGDLWCNNIMFQHNDKGELQQTIFVDYQLPKYGSPAQDLLYFILSSTEYDIKLKHFDYFIQYYHEQLIEHLVLLKYAKKLPTLRQLQSEILRHSEWAIRTTAGVMCIVLLESNKDSTLENLMDDNEQGKKFKRLMYSNERYRRHMELVVPWMYNRGALEC